MRDAIHEGVVLNALTLIEAAHYLHHLPKEDLLKSLHRIENLAATKFVSLDLDLAELALEQLTGYAKIGIDGRESVILATMKKRTLKG